MKNIKNKPNKTISSEIEDKMNEFWATVNKNLSNQLKEYHKQRNEEFELALLNNCKPKIKGKITKGKIKWRGIVQHRQYNNDFTMTEWISQRGVQISKKTTFCSTPSWLSVFAKSNN